MAKDFTRSHAMSREAMSQSCSQHVLAVLESKPLGFPEAVHSPSSSAESELLLSLLSFRTRGFFFWAKILLVHCSGRSLVLGCFVSMWLGEPTVGCSDCKK